MLVQRARERTHYPREWGVTIEYENEKQEKEQDNVAEPGIETGGIELERKSVVIHPDDFDQKSKGVQFEDEEAKETEIPQSKTDMNEALEAFNELNAEPSKKANLRA